MPAQRHGKSSDSHNLWMLTFLIAAVLACVLGYLFNLRGGTLWLWGALWLGLRYWAGRPSKSSE